jgi:hypothetical protein
MADPGYYCGELRRKSHGSRRRRGQLLRLQHISFPGYVDSVGRRVPHLRLLSGEHQYGKQAAGHTLFVCDVQRRRVLHAAGLLHWNCGRGIVRDHRWLRRGPLRR